MITAPPILRNSALAWPLTVALGAAFGLPTAVAAGASGLLCLVNLAALAVVGPRFVDSLARLEGGGLWGPLLVMKTVVMLAVMLRLLEVLPPLGVGLGLTSLMFGALITALSARPHDAHVEV